MTIDLLLTQPLPADIDAELTARYAVHRLYEAADRDALIDRVAPRIRGVVTGGANGLSRAWMDRLPALEIVAINGIGTDAVDLECARSRGIHVTTTPDVLTDDVADMAMGLILMTLRDLGAGDRIVRARRWGTVAQPLATQVTGKRLGIVGLGRVGRAIAERARAFRMPVSYCGPREHPGCGCRYVADPVTLARDSDVLVVAASADHGTVLVTADVLAALGPQGFLINVARGKLVDEAALVRALASGTIAGAGLDVFANEPHVPAELLELERVVVQPHRASATHETRREMGRIVLANLAACFAGQRPPTSVTT
ncbi:2-hydroxyacid dehydrogenase [Burkholderia ubonensis]|uniref:Dihydrofolate reductase n=1 Tax=Burkholderia ubonensis subsp. mesacidophila TaxID=265293 RepID=A0A2A4FGW1_9BURK|nr:2-hydroxyacid dehydrogenase [Burkholderia ubonensis]PCE32963.1 dihydrofolate reductase [Burkholderia ubonensis subsp. mesacidophila]